MSSPDLKNGRIPIAMGFNHSDHIQAACWFNITDENLKNQLLQHWKENNTSPSISLIRILGGKEEGYPKDKISTFRLFTEEYKKDTSDSGEAKGKAQVSTETEKKQILDDEIPF